MGDFEKPRLFIPRNSAALVQARNSSRWRESVLKPYAKRPYQEQQERKLHNVTSSKNDFVRFQGVSLYYLNQFWRDIENKVKFKDVRLFIDRHSKSTVMWEKHKKEKTKNGKIALCRQSSTDPTDNLVEIPIKNLVEKPRTEWSISDISNYCIYPTLAGEQDMSVTVVGLGGARSFLDSIEKGYVGSEFDGSYLVYDRSCKFVDLVRALRSHYKDTDRPILSIFVYLDFLATDLEKVRIANQGRDRKLRTFYDALITSSLHKAIESFDERLILIENWQKPRLLKRLWNVWETYGVFLCDDEFEVINNDYESIKNVWDNDGDDIFSLIEHMDPSNLSSVSPYDEQAMAQVYTTFSKGFTSIRELLNKRFSQYVAVEAEKNVKFFNDLKTEDVYTKLCDLLVVSGVFMTRRQDYVVANSYLSQAVQLYEYFDVESYLKKVNDEGEDLDRPRHFTKSFINELLVGLVKSRLNLANVLMKQNQLPRALELIEVAKVAADRITISTEKTDNLMECEIVHGRWYSKNEEPKKAVESFKIVEVTWKIDEDKSSKVTQLCYEMGIELKKAGEFEKALKWLAIALDRHQTFLTEKGRAVDVFLADIYSATGDVYNKRHSLDEARNNYEHALNLVYRCIGTVNTRVGKLGLYIGNCFARQKNYELALLNYSKAVDILAKAQGESTTEVAAAYNSRGLVYRFQKRRDKEEESFRNALRVAKQLKNPASFKRKYLLIANYGINLGVTLREVGRNDEADQMFDEASEIKKRELGPDHPETRKVLEMKRENLLHESY